MWILEVTDSAYRRACEWRSQDQRLGRRGMEGTENELNPNGKERAETLKFFLRFWSKLKPIFVLVVYEEDIRLLFLKAFQALGVSPWKPLQVGRKHPPCA